MGFNEKEKSLEYWDNIHSKYERNEIKLDDWLDKFETIIDSCSTPILDLGCGSGNDTLYLINKNKQVISCDQSSNAINNIKKNFPEVYDTKCFNMLDGMPFDNNSFELIIAIKKCKNEINTLETNNKHEIEKLMKQHKIDIEALNEKHRLEIETKEKEHQLKIEEIKVQNEQEILKREKELSNSAMYSMMGDATKDLFAGIFNSPEFKEEMSKKIKEGFNKK